MRLELICALLLSSASTATAQLPQRTVRAPVLKNRIEIMSERQRLANKVLKRGDSLSVKVFAYVDEHGVTRQPDVKTSSGNAQADTAAMMLVRQMIWYPAQNAKRGVMLTIPVVFVRK
jgi:TonB family protein